MEDFRYKSRSFDIEEKIDTLVAESKFKDARDLYILAAKQGSSNACEFLAGAMDSRATMYPEEMQAQFVPHRRKANRYYNRLLKCLRKEASEGTYSSMFNLYNQHNWWHPRLRIKNRLVLAEKWLRMAAQSGDSIPENELRLFLRSVKS